MTLTYKLDLSGPVCRSSVKVNHHDKYLDQRSSNSSSKVIISGHIGRDTSDQFLKWSVINTSVDELIN